MTRKKKRFFSSIAFIALLAGSVVSAKQHYGEETPIPYPTFRNVFDKFLQQIAGKDLHMSIIGKASIEDIMALLQSNPKYKYRISGYQFKSSTFRLEVEDLIAVLDIIHKKYPIQVIRYWDMAEQIHRYETSESQKSYAISQQIVEKLIEGAKTEAERMNYELQRQALIRDRLNFQQFYSYKKAEIEYSQVN